MKKVVDKAKDMWYSNRVAAESNNKLNLDNWTVMQPWKFHEPEAGAESKRAEVKAEGKRISETVVKNHKTERPKTVKRKVLKSQNDLAGKNEHE